MVYNYLCYALLFVSFVKQVVFIFVEKKFKVILILGFVLIYIWHTICFIFNFGRPIDDAGYGIPNFVYLYLFGRYLKIHCNISIFKRNFLIDYISVCMLPFIFQLSYSLVLGFSFTSLLSYNTVFVFFGGYFYSCFLQN